MTTLQRKIQIQKDEKSYQEMVSILDRYLYRKEYSIDEKFILNSLVLDSSKSLIKDYSQDKEKLKNYLKEFDRFLGKQFLKYKKNDRAMILKSFNLLKKYKDSISNFKCQNLEELVLTQSYIFQGLKGFERLGYLRDNFDYLDFLYLFINYDFLFKPCNFKKFKEIMGKVYISYDFRIRELNNFMYKDRKDVDIFFKKVTMFLFEKYTVSNWVRNELVVVLGNVDLYLDLAKGNSIYQYFEYYNKKFYFKNKKIFNLFFKSNESTKNAAYADALGKYYFPNNDNLQEQVYRAIDVCDNKFLNHYLDYYSNKSNSEEYLIDLLDYVVFLEGEYNNRNKKFYLFNFSFDKLITDMRVWEDQNHIDKKLINKKWESVNLKPLIIEEVNVGGRLYSLKVEELLDARELAREGRIQSHCVGHYISRCIRGHSSIWSLRYYKDDKLVKIGATIEYSPRSKKLVQVKAKANFKVTDLNTKYITKWEKLNNL